MQAVFYMGPVCQVVCRRYFTCTDFVENAGFVDGVRQQSAAAIGTCIEITAVLVVIVVLYEWQDFTADLL
jgi:hypothetical protein